MARKSKPSPLTAINAIIMSQESYGDRRWPVSNWSKATILHWSNSAAAWNIWGPAKRHWKRDGSSVTLDANEIVVPFIPKVVRPILPKLKPLGLYGRSYEGRRRSLANQSTPQRPVRLSFLRETKKKIELSVEFELVLGVQHWRSWGQELESIVARLHRNGDPEKFSLDPGGPPDYRAPFWWLWQENLTLDEAGQLGAEIIAILQKHGVPFTVDLSDLRRRPRSALAWKLGRRRAAGPAKRGRSAHGGKRYKIRLCRGAASTEVFAPDMMTAIEAAIDRSHEGDFWDMQSETDVEVLQVLENRGGTWREIED